jgi:threonine aldolase
MRFVSAQLEAYLSDDLWLRLAGISNGRMAQLVTAMAPLTGDHLRILETPAANICYLDVSAALLSELRASGLLFHGEANGRIRFVTSWQTTELEVAAVIDRIAAALACVTGAKRDA